MMRKEWTIGMDGALLLAAGCNKNAQGSATALAQTDGYDGQGAGDGAGSGGDDASLGGRSAGDGKEYATGDMRDLLLTLKRVHFALDGATLTDDAKTALTDAAAQLQDYPEVSLYVDGHTDNRGTGEYNMSLGERRSRTVVKYLTDLGVSASRLNVVSFGEELPLEPGSSEHALARNRRVDFRLMRGDIELVLEDGDLVDDEGKPIP